VRAAVAALALVTVISGCKEEIHNHYLQMAAHWIDQPTDDYNYDPQMRFCDRILRGFRHDPADEKPYARLTKRCRDVIVPTLLTLFLLRLGDKKHSDELSCGFAYAILETAPNPTDSARFDVYCCNHSDYPSVKPCLGKPWIAPITGEMISGDYLDHSSQGNKAMLHPSAAKGGK